MLKIKLKIKQYPLVGKTYRHTENKASWKYTKVFITEGIPYIIYEFMTDSDGSDGSGTYGTQELSMELKRIKEGLYKEVIDG
jgi:hypothetical protein